MIVQTLTIMALFDYGPDGADYQVHFLFPLELTTSDQASHAIFFLPMTKRSIHNHRSVGSYQEPKILMNEMKDYVILPCCLATSPVRMVRFGMICSIRHGHRSKQALM